MKTWTHAEHADAAGREIARMAAAVWGVDVTIPVPTCPDWTLKGLIEHTGTIHRWARDMVADLAPRRYTREDVDFGIPGDPSGLAAWLAEGGERLVATLKAADPGASMWAWGADQHVRFWSRRQLHESVIHRVDAEIAIGLEPVIEEAVAADGVEEFLDILPFAVWRSGVAELKGEGETISLKSRAFGWLIQLTPSGYAYERSDAPGDVTVRAETTGDLMLFAWGRRPAPDVTGDVKLLQWWVERSAI